MKKTIYLLVLLVAIVLCLLVSEAFAENRSEPYHFLDIPYGRYSYAEISKLLSEKYGYILENNPVLDLCGYPMVLGIDIIDNTVDRITLRDAEDPWASEEEFRDLTQQDVDLFVALDQNLTKLYGEPDYRYFASGDKRYPKMPQNTFFMFGDGQWSQEALMHLFDHDDRTFRTWSIWNNVVLELWVRGFQKTQFGYCNILRVYYYPEKQIRHIELIDYPFAT